MQAPLLHARPYTGDAALCVPAHACPPAARPVCPAPAQRPISRVETHAHERQAVAETSGRPALSKREALLGGLALLGALARPRAARALLRSQASDQPCTLTFYNKTARTLKLYWVNYDADRELFALLPPQGEYTVGSFKSHPWSAVDAESGQVVQDYVAQEGFQLIPIQEAAGSSGSGSGSSSSGSRSNGSLQPERLPYSGWDGLGSTADDYAPAELQEVSVGLAGGVASLKVEGFSQPLGITIGLPEAAALLYASGLESRRPSTLKTWQESLQAAGASIERVMLTRLVGSTYYSRIVLSVGAGKLASVDSRPSDSLALALQSGTPVFVSKRIAEENEEEVTRIMRDNPPLLPDASELLGLDDEEAPLAAFPQDA